MQNDKRSRSVDFYHETPKSTVYCNVILYIKKDYMRKILKSSYENM